eukprot:gene3449-3920_t
MFTTVQASICIICSDSLKYISFMFQIQISNTQALLEQLRPQLNNQQGSHGGQDDSDSAGKKKKNAFTEMITRNLISFTVFGVFSLGMAASNDETEYMLKNADKLLEDILKTNELSIVESRLATLSECSSMNDTIKTKLADAALINKLLDVIETVSNIEVNVHAVKIIENASPYITDFSVVPRIVELSTTKYLPAYVRRTLGVAISKIAANEEARVILANSGAISSLEELCQHKMLKKQIFNTALLAISYTAMANIDKLVVTDDEMASIEKYAKEESAFQSSSLLSTKRQLVESGWLLYLHTSAGGFVWGCVESFRNRRSMDTTKEKFILYFTGIYSMYPWYYILPKLEAYSPNWIGGHVLGFMSFFTWLVYTKNEIFNSDSLIIQKDKSGPPRERLIKAILERKEAQQALVLANNNNSNKK